MAIALQSSLPVILSMGFQFSMDFTPSLSLTSLNESQASFNRANQTMISMPYLSRPLLCV